jgi:hypothetical protein
MAGMKFGPLQAIVFVLGFMACWFLGLTALIISRTNIQPGIKWWSLPICRTRDDFRRTFTPKGIFWMKVAVGAIIAGFAWPLLFHAATAMWWR